MDEIILVDKPIGLTPLQTLGRLRELRPELQQVQLGYAGRLDPMAQGLLLVLVGQSTRRQEELSHLDKEYELEVTLGVSTDTYDILGMPQHLDEDTDLSDEQIRQPAVDLVGEFEQPYPPYSAVQVNGRPLYWWARHQRLGEIVIPSRRRRVMSANLVDRATVPASEWLGEIERQLALVSGDFRQTAILPEWQRLLAGRDQEFPRFVMRIDCSSGTFMRSLADELGRRLGTGGVATKIRRVRIGTFTLADTRLVELV